MAFRVQIALVPAMGLALLGCAASDPVDVTSPGSAGAAGIVGSGQRRREQHRRRDRQRRRISTGGVNGTGGAGGVTGSGGVEGTGGTGTVTSDGGVGTFTAVYADVISKYCFGASCHNPGGAGLSQLLDTGELLHLLPAARAALPRAGPDEVVHLLHHVGDPTASPPSPPYMPPTPNANVSAADLAIVAAWIADGALND